MQGEGDGFAHKKKNAKKKIENLEIVGIQVP